MSWTLRSVLRTGADRGIWQLLRLATERLLLRGIFSSRISRSLYWSVAPPIYGRHYPTDVDAWEPRPNPFKTEPVDPNRITRFTRRWYPPWHQRPRLFGTVLTGDWDRRSCDDVPVVDGPPRHLYDGETVQETELYMAIGQRLMNDVPWTDTAFIREVIAMTRERDRPVWAGCQSTADILRRCHRMDELRYSLEKHGYVPYTDRTDPGERTRGFVESLESEIVVDIGRDGELLLVSGKHRLYMAQILGLQEVSVVFLVRHRRWMQTRQRHANGDITISDHPDLAGLDSEQDAQTTPTVL